MNSILRRVPFRLTPLSAIGLLLAVAACGTITIDVRTQIISQQEITQELEYVIAGPIAALFITDGEIDLDQGTSLGDMQALEDAGWTINMEVQQIDGDDALVMRISQTFKGEDAAEQFRLAAAALAEEDESTTMVPELTITENEDEIVYDLRMVVSAEDPSAIDPEATPEATATPLVIDGTPFPGLPDFSGTVNDGLQDFTDALTDSIGDFITMKWTVEMPGKVQESNATTAEKGEPLVWDLSFSDLTAGDKELFATSSVSKNTGSCNK